MIKEYDKTINEKLFSVDRFKEGEEYQTTNITNSGAHTVSTPDDALEVIRASVGYCPRARINMLAGSTIHIRNNRTNATQQYTVPSTGYVIVDFLSFDTYSIWGVLNGVVTTTETLVVDTIKMYTVDVDFYICTWKFTVEAEIGATITVRHADGLTFTGTVASDRTCSIILPKTGTWTAVGVYSSCNSASYTFNATAATEGTTNTTAMKWITATINVTTGSIVTLVQNSVTRGGTAANNTLKVWLPSTGTWAVTATLGSSVTTGSIVTSAYQNYTLALSYYVTYGVRIPLGNSSPTALEYTDDAVGMNTGYTPWADKQIFRSIKPCLLLNGVVQYYLNPNNLAQKADGSAATINSTAAGDVMVEIPKIGYRIYSDSTYLYVKITDQPNAPNFCYLAHSLDNINDCDKIYMGAYLAYGENGKLHSISGATIAINIGLSTARIRAEAKGTGYQLVSLYPWTLLQCLYTVMYRNLNSESTIGWGIIGQSTPKPTGGTNDKGPCYGAQSSDQQVCFLNIEDVWAHMQCHLDGLVSDGSRNLKAAYKGFNDTGANYPYSLTTGFSQLTNGYVKEVQGTNEFGFVMKSIGGSASTYFCDEGTVQVSCTAHTGGNYNMSGGTNGMFNLEVYMLQSQTNGTSSTAARILYKHKA